MVREVALVEDSSASMDFLRESVTLLFFRGFKELNGFMAA
jgi:hypothetical protein